MPAIVHLGRRCITFMAVAALLILATTSCSPESTPSPDAKPESLQGTSLQPIPLSDLPEQPVKSSSVPVTSVLEQDATAISTAALATSVAPQEASASSEIRGEVSTDMPPSPPKETSLAAKEDSVKQVMNSKSPPQDDSLVSQFFPMPDGATWQYQLKVLDSKGETLSEATVERRVEGAKAIAGKDYARLTTTTLSGTDTRAPDQHYRVTKEGVVAAVEGVAGKELLVLPIDPSSHQSWSGEAPPIIKSVSASASIGEEVSIGNDVLTGCVRVDMDFVMRGAGLFAPREVPVRIERWFAPGVGMVRERRIAGGRTIEAVLEKKQL